MESYIRFDWAMKRLLRNKANYAVLEGLLTTLLEEKVTIHKLLESDRQELERYRDTLRESFRQADKAPAGRSGDHGHVG